MVVLHDNSHEAAIAIEPELGNRLTIDETSPSEGCRRPATSLRERRLAATRRPGDHNGFARSDAQIDVPEDPGLVVAV